MLKKPCARRTCPEPLQVPQVLGEVPGCAPEPLHFLHFECRWNFICF